MTEIDLSLSFVAKVHASDSAMSPATSVNTSTPIVSQVSVRRSRVMPLRHSDRFRLDDGTRTASPFLRAPWLARRRGRPDHSVRGPWSSSCVPAPSGCSHCWLFSCSLDDRGRWRYRGRTPSSCERCREVSSAPSTRSALWSSCGHGQANARRGERTSRPGCNRRTGLPPS